ncbi:MAG: hypothetical protein GXP53_00360, partial [Deltaproteobacteria bacterium]|nr:hypothetical protein [Deltaproteobacteria bacterium]
MKGKNQRHLFIPVLIGILLVFGSIVPSFGDTLTGPYLIWDLGTLGWQESRAFDVNINDVVAGSSMLDGVTEHAFIWDTTNGMTDLGVLPGGTYSRAFIINDNGIVLGDSDDGTNTYGFVYDGTSMTKLGGPLANLTEKAYDVNSSDIVVGPEADAAGAIIMDETGASVNLNDLIPATSEQGEAFSNIVDATGINDNGSIVGSGTIAVGEPHAGEWHAFLMKPDKVDHDGDGVSGWDGDCDDNNDAVYPGATEICNGVDDNCDGNIDENLLTTYYLDSDSDGYGDTSVPTDACSVPPGYVADNGDCNDNDAAIHPFADEICDNIDNNCDGATDTDAIDKTTWYADTDSDGYGNPSVSSVECNNPGGYVTDNTDCNDTNNAVNPGADEICNNNIDDDCDGTTDINAVDQQTYYQDSDSDGYGDASVSTTACSLPTGYVADNDDCNDTDSAINPGADDVCDGVDNDCDGFVDNDVDFQPTWYADSDSDTYGDPNITLTQCDQPAGYVADNSDCDDTSAAINPATVWYADTDSDTYGDPTNTTAQCTQPAGYVADNTDCDDNDAAINPDTVWYADSDTDTYGDPTNTTAQCTQPAGYVADNTDCD